MNVASKWGMTKRNYTELVQLHQKFREQGFQILAFPCNQFMNQEPGDRAQIQAFAQNYGVEFPMFDKIDVNGPGTHGVYKFLRANIKEEPGRKIPWNFAKFLVNANGQVQSFHVSDVNPLKLEPEIQQMLQAWNKQWAINQSIYLRTRSVVVFADF